MTICSTQSCAHDTAIAKHDASIDTLAKYLEEMRSDIKEMKNVLQVLSAVQVETTHTKESLNRAFGRIEALEREKAHDDDVSSLEKRIFSLEEARKDYDAFINQARGMKTLAWALWTILASGLGLVIVKLFVIAEKI